MIFAIVFIYQTAAVIVNGISSRPFKTVCGLNLPAEGTIIDLKFLDDESLLVLCRLKGLFSAFAISRDLF